MGALITALVLAFTVTGSGTNPTATTNCNPAIDVTVGSVTGLAPGVKVDVPVTVSDEDDCAGVGVTITSATRTLTGVPGCGAGNYTVGSATPLPAAVPDGGSAVIQISVTLNVGAGNGCIGATAALQVNVNGTVP